MANMVERLLAELVSIPSVNPMGQRAAEGISHEGRLADFVERWFRERGIECRREVVQPGRDNLLVRFDAPASTRLILFDVHLDTVPVEGMTIPPFQPAVSGGRLYGRGACDVKGSMAAMMIALDRLERERPRSAASLLLAFTVDEEFTHLGSSHLAASRTGADLAIVAEPTGLDLVDCHKGALRWIIRTRGVACHSSNPAQGENAIYRMARVLSVLEAHALELAWGPSDPVLGPPTLSVGRIEGGRSVNIVPDDCLIEIDRRLVPGETAGDALGRVRSALDAQLGRPDWLVVEEPWTHLPPLERRAGPWLEPVADAVARAIGRQPQIRGVPFGTDAGPLSESGIPCLIFGPGHIDQAHTKDEWIALDQLEPAAEAYYLIVRSLG